MTTLNWENTDILTPDELFLSVRLVSMGGAAKVFNQSNEVVAEGVIVDWCHSGQSRLYKAQMQDGTEWEVVKLKCRCSDRQKSGRMWA